MPDRDEIAANVRRLATLAQGTGPDDNRIVAAVTGFVAQFEYWYTRVLREAVPDYRNLIIKRINPFIRRIEFEGLTAHEVATHLIEDYAQRNFVTAGGWALEAMASAGGIDVQKSGAAGIDLQRYDPATGDYYLYVLKSGLVTRNSDIVNALKVASRKAEKLLRQDKSTGAVHANYVILAGKTNASFEDGVNRPSSAEFWGDMFRLPEDKAVDLALAIAAEAGRLVRRDASVPLKELSTLTGAYIAKPGSPEEVDWDFIAERNMRKAPLWKVEDQRRHAAAIAVLEAARREGKLEPTDATAAQIAKEE